MKGVCGERGERDARLPTGTLCNDCLLSVMPSPCTCVFIDSEAIDLGTGEEYRGEGSVASAGEESILWKVCRALGEVDEPNGGVSERSLPS